MSVKIYFNEFKLNSVTTFFFQKVGIYTDLNGHGTFACQVKNKLGKVKCEMVGVMFMYINT